MQRFTIKGFCAHDIRLLMLDYRFEACQLVKISLERRTLNLCQLVWYLANIDREKLKSETLVRLLPALCAIAGQQ